jgi:hypothetical protein
LPKTISERAPREKRLLGSSSDHKQPAAACTAAERIAARG